jgi:type VI protein secretion system component VasK
LRSLSVRVPPEPALAAGKLSGYASATQGLPAVLGRVMSETNPLAPPSQAQATAEKSKLGTGKLGKLAKLVMQNRDADKRKLKEQFRFVEELAGPTGGVLQDYLIAVKGLSEVLSRISLSGDAAGETMMAAQQLFQGKTESPLNFCWNESNKVKARYEGQSWLFPLLENPVRDVAAYLADAVGKQLEAAYQQRVISFYNQNLRGKYPMIKLGPQEANLDDLKSFFNPENGVFATFVSGKLQPFVKEGDDGYTVRAWNGVRLPFNGNSLQAIYRTQQVQKRLYTDNPPSMRIYTVNLTLPEVRNTARITFRLGDDRLSVKPGEGQARATLRWPNENTYKGAEILVENVGGGSQGRRIDGSWGLMKLLDGSRALNQRPGGFSAKWRFNVAQKYDVDVLLDANLTERDNPFSTPDFFKFELPGTLLEAGSAISP